MGRLAGFKYRQITRKLRALGFEFDRQAAGSHEIWFNPETNKYTTCGWIHGGGEGVPEPEGHER